MDDSFKEELLPEFVIESREHLDSVEPGLLEIEEYRGEGIPETINEVFRAIHSLKGAASFFGFANVTSLAHVMENLLMKVRDGELRLTSDQIDLLISGTDKLRLMIDDLDDSESVDATAELAGLKQFLDESVEDAEANHPVLPAEGKQVSPDCGPMVALPEAIQKLVERGHFFYRIGYSLGRHIYDQGLLPQDTKGLLASVGTVLQDDLSMTDLPGPGDPKAAETRLSFILATVLEEEYLVEGINLEPGQIQTLTPDEAATIHLEAATAEAVSPEAPNRSGTVDAGGKREVHGKASTDLEVIETLRVPVATLNKLMDLAGELVLSRNQLKQAAEQLADNAVAPLMQSLDLVTTELQTTIMNARLQPIGTLLNKFPRVIRDLAHQLGKEIDLVIEGKEVDMDKSIIETLSDPLTHLIRNAADHGIEFPQERLNRGKPRQGTVRLRAYHKNEQIHIDIADDGSGIDPESLKRRVLEKQLLPAEELQAMSPQDLTQLIFLPGFSTVEDITEVSGRGVGMDVVKTNVERLGGSIDLYSIPGQGTTVTLRLPLTLAIIPAQIIDVSGVRYAIPQVNLEEMVQVDGDRGKYRLERIAGREVLRLREELLPLVDLQDMFHDQSAMSPMAMSPQKDHQAKKSILVLSSGSYRFGLIVSEMLDSEEIVVKPLSSYVKVCRYYAGATILGNGRVAMILDAAGLAEAARLDFSSIQVEQARTPVEDEAASDINTAPFLIFEGGVGQMFGLPLQFVARVDKISVNDLIELNGETFFQYQGNLIRLIWLNRFLRASGPPEDIETIHVVVPRIVPHPIGIGAIEVYDIARTNVELNCEDHPERGALGSAVVDGQPVLFIDLYELFELAAPEQYISRVVTDTLRPDGILIADSNPIHRALLANYLRAAGCSPVMVSGGMEAFQEIQTGRYQTLLLASRLPVMDTPVLLSRVRGFDRTRDLNIIGLKDLEESSDDRADSERWLDAQVLKFDKTALIEIIGTVPAGSGEPI